MPRVSVFLSNRTLLSVLETFIQKNMAKRVCQLCGTVGHKILLMSSHQLFLGRPRPDRISFSDQIKISSSILEKNICYFYIVWNPGFWEILFVPHIKDWLFIKASGVRFHPRKTLLPENTLFPKTNGCCRLNSRANFESNALTTFYLKMNCLFAVKLKLFLNFKLASQCKV